MPKSQERCQEIREETRNLIIKKSVLYFAFVIVSTFRLLRSEKIDSLLILVIPVIIALSRCVLVLNVELKRFLINPVILSQKPFV